MKNGTSDGKRDGVIQTTQMFLRRFLKIIWRMEGSYGIRESEVINSIWQMRIINTCVELWIICQKRQQKEALSIMSLVMWKDLGMH